MPSLQSVAHRPLGAMVLSARVPRTPHWLAVRRVWGTYRPPWCTSLYCRTTAELSAGDLRGSEAFEWSAQLPAALFHVETRQFGLATHRSQQSALKLAPA